MRRCTLSIFSWLFCFSDLCVGQIESVKYRGSGCLAGTVATSLSSENDRLTIIYDKFFAEVDQNNRGDRSTCRLDLSIKIPKGKTIGVFGVNTRGYVYLDEGVRARVRGHYKIGRHGVAIPLINEEIKGEVDSDFMVSGRVSPRSLKSRWCSQGEPINLVLKTSLTIRTRNGDLGYAVVDSTDGALNQEMEVSYLDCLKKTYVTMCEVSYLFKHRSKKTQKRIERIRTFRAYGTGKSRRRSIQKAKMRARKKCSKAHSFNKRKPYRCNFSCGAASLL